MFSKREAAAAGRGFAAKAALPDVARASGVGGKPESESRAENRISGGNPATANGFLFSTCYNLLYFAIADYSTLSAFQIAKYSKK